jgi:ribosomal protein S18 acetylase RimI-like enzyme
MDTVYCNINRDNFSNIHIKHIKEIQRGILDNDMYKSDFWYEIMENSTASYIAYTAENNINMPIGYIVDTYLENECNDYIIASFGVKKKYQNMGIGKHLLNLCLNELKKKKQTDEKNGINRDIILQVRMNNHNAKKFYENNGFKCRKILHNYYENEEDGTSDGYEMVYCSNY